jgi:glycosyltransferase involved in cell wall biosynthesis
MRILHIDNMGSVAHTLVHQFRSLGHDALLIGIYNPRESPCDVEIRPEGDMSDPAVRRKTVRHEFKQIRKRIDDYDFIHIHGGVGMSGLYYKFIKTLKRNKSIIIHFHGSDIRMDLNTRFASVADLIMVSTPDLLKYSKNVGGRKLIHIPNPVDLSDFESVDLQKRPPLIEKEQIIVSHLPSYRGFKGTEHVVKAVEELKKKYPIELNLIENVKRKKALKMLSESDICVDWVSDKFDIYGMVSIEAMAIGIPTICHFNPDYYSPPLQNADPNNLNKKIEELIQDPKLMKRLSKEGIEYIRKTHDSRRIAKKIIGFYKSIGKV